jgi:hypothetical protein
MPCVVTTLHRLQEVLIHKWWSVGPRDTTVVVTESAPISSSFIIPVHFCSQCSLPVLSYSASQLSALWTQDNVTSSVTSPILKRLQTKGLLFAIMMTRDLTEFVRSVLGHWDREENHGNDKDDRDSDWFSVMITITVSAQGDVIKKPKKLHMYMFDR